AAAPQPTDAPHLRLVQLRRQPPPPPHRPTRLRRAEIEERVRYSERQHLLLRYLRDSHTATHHPALTSQILLWLLAVLRRSGRDVAAGEPA
ncbi:unnamed protein product, partial [Urochloa humidicola]